MGHHGLACIRTPFRCSYLVHCRQICFYRRLKIQLNFASHITCVRKLCLWKISTGWMLVTRSRSFLANKCSTLVGHSSKQFSHKSWKNKCAQKYLAVAALENLYQRQKSHWKRTRSSWAKKSKSPSSATTLPALRALDPLNSN